MTKYIFAFLLICFFSSPGFATPIPAEKGQQYYQNCMKNQDPRLLPGTQDPFCQCTAKNMLKNMTMEDLVGLKNNERPALNKMMIGAYAPCLEYPVHDDVRKECDRQGLPAATCHCLASNIGKFTSREAQRLLSGVLAKHPNAFDPVAVIKQTPEFEQQTENIARQCAEGTLK